jgi:hypothetical protein
MQEVSDVLMLAWEEGGSSNGTARDFPVYSLCLIFDYATYHRLRSTESWERQTKTLF